MSGAVKRAYNSPRRQEQAAATRRAILDSALRLFVEQGYAATTMESIAVEAGVSLKTVYLAFDTKGRLLRAVWDLALKGDVDDAPVAARPWYQEVLATKSAEKQLLLTAHNSCIVKRRIGPVLAVIRDASSSDPDSGELWTLIQSDFYANQRIIVESIAGKHALVDGLDVDRATDILWTLNHPDLWLLLVGQRGWTPEEFERWFAETACVQLLGRRPRARASSDRS